MAPKSYAVDFLTECHESVSETFANSRNPPEDVAQKYRDRRIDLDELWITYLRSKFRFLLRLEDDPEKDVAAFQAELKEAGAPESHIARFVSHWRDTHQDERLVYLLRSSQLPDRTVRGWWYHQDISECYEWCELREQELRSMREEARASPWIDRVVRTYSELADVPHLHGEVDLRLAATFRHGIERVLREVTEACEVVPGAELDESKPLPPWCRDTLSDINKSLRSISSYQPGCPYLQPESDSQSLLARLPFAMTEALHEEQFDETQFIRRFLFIVRDEFNCEVCDYVDVVEDVEKIEWRTATVGREDMSEEMRAMEVEDQREHVEKRESYRKGRGISGTVLMQPIDPAYTLWNHVGSNDVPNDPRTLEHVATAYQEDLYRGALKVDGKLHNFWMFPVTRAGELIGAFRVVNKLYDENHLQAGGWPYPTRVELAVIAQWFSKFLEAIQPLLLTREDFLLYLAWGGIVDKLRDDLGLDWVDTRAYVPLLRHFARTRYRKEEKRRMGSSVLIVENKDDATRTAHPLQDYPMIDLKPGEIPFPYTRLDSLLDALDPRAGAWVFTEKGRYVRAVRLAHDGVSGEYALQSLTNDQRCLWIVLPRNARNILLFEDGTGIGELCFDELAGVWRPRVIRSLEQELNGKVKDADEFVTMALRACLELSAQQHGALLVIGDIPPDAIRLEQLRPYLSRRTHARQVGIPLLVELAKLEGAVVIDRAGWVTHVNTVLNPIDPGPLKIFKDRGTRHKTAEKVSNVAPEALVLVVSENGGISVLQDGHCYLKSG